MYEYKPYKSTDIDYELLELEGHQLKKLLMQFLIQAIRDYMNKDEDKTPPVPNSAAYTAEKMLFDPSYRLILNNESHLSLVEMIEILVPDSCNEILDAIKKLKKSN